MSEPRKKQRAPSKIDAAAALARVREICLALPETSEKLAWSAPTFRVRDRLFVMFVDNHHRDGRLAIWCNAPPGAQQAMVAADPENFFVPPYVGPGGWLGVHLDRGLGWPPIAGIVAEAHRVTASGRPALKTRVGRRSPKRSRGDA